VLSHGATELVFITDKLYERTSRRNDGSYAHVCGMVESSRKIHLEFSISLDAVIDI